MNKSVHTFVYLWYDTWLISEYLLRITLDISMFFFPVFFCNPYFLIAMQIPQPITLHPMTVKPSVKFPLMSVNDPESEE